MKKSGYYGGADCPPFGIFKFQPVADFISEFFRCYLRDKALALAVFRPAVISALRTPVPVPRMPQDIH